MNDKTRQHQKDPLPQPRWISNLGYGVVYVLLWGFIIAFIMALSTMPVWLPAVITAIFG